MAALQRHQPYQGVWREDQGERSCRQDEEGLRAPQEVARVFHSFHNRPGSSICYPDFSNEGYEKMLHG